MNVVTSWGKTTLWGVLSLFLYLLLFLNQGTVLQWTSQGRWSFVIPVVIAFGFSYVHGTFTGAFWDSLGIKGRLESEPVAKPRPRACCFVPGREKMLTYVEYAALFSHPAPRLKPDAGVLQLARPETFSLGAAMELSSFITLDPGQYAFLFIVGFIGGMVSGFIGSHQLRRDGVGSAGGRGHDPQRHPARHAGAQ